MKPLDDQTEPAEAARAWISALTDGRAEACEPAVAAWARDARARQAWHTYQLIGDVLRSEDLAAPAQRDEAFLQSLRLRLAQEPVVLSPAPLEPNRLAPDTVVVRRQPRTTLRWGAAAALAGVFMVGGVAYTLQRAGGETQIAASVAPTRGAPSSLTPVQLPLAPAEPEAQQWRMLNERVLRDARLDDYLRAHRGSRAVGGRVEPVALER